MKKVTFITLILIVFILSSCTKKVDTNQNSDNSEAKTDVAAELEDIPSTEDEKVIFVDNIGDFTDYKALIEGSVSFDEDTSFQASVEFLVDGTEKTINLEDGNGLIWELIIPDDALNRPETIKMTAMKNINSSIGTIEGGVVLKPDGLLFNAPAILSVKGLGVEKTGILFSGNMNGDELEQSIVQKEQDLIKIELLHFSTAFATSDQQVFDSIAEDAQNSIRKLSALAKQILNRPIEVLVPPAIAIKCHHDTEAQDDVNIAKYVKDFGKPEIDIINSLLAAKTTVEFSTGEKSDFTLELRLTNRLIKKGAMLIKQYRGQEEMFFAVSSTTINTERQAMLLGATLNDGQSVLPIIAEWAQSIAQKYLDDLVKNHQYKNIHPIMKLAYSQALLGSKEAKSFMDKLHQSLKFQLKTTNTIKIGEGTSIATYVVESIADIMLLNVSKIGMIEGRGTGTYKSYEVPLVDGTDFKITFDQLGKSFDILVGIEGFNPCKSETFTIHVNRFGAENETITVTLPDIPPTSKSRPVVQQVCEKGFEDKNKGGLFAFDVTLIDGNKVAVEQTFTASGKGMDVEYQVTLTHTP